LLERVRVRGKILLHKPFILKNTFIYMNFGKFMYNGIKAAFANAPEIEE